MFSDARCRPVGEGRPALEAAAALVAKCLVILVTSARSPGLARPDPVFFGYTGKAPSRLPRFVAVGV